MTTEADMTRLLRRSTILGALLMAVGLIGSVVLSDPAAMVIEIRHEPPGHYTATTPIGSATSVYGQPATWVVGDVTYTLVVEREGR